MRGPPSGGRTERRIVSSPVFNPCDPRLSLLQGQGLQYNLGFV